MGQRLDSPVQVLGIRSALFDRHTQHPGFLSQPLDRVDLTVVAKNRERLHAPERGPGVGRVAVVAEARHRLKALVEEVWEVLTEDVWRAHHLVDAGRGGERRHVNPELAFELDHQLEQDPVAPGRVGDQPADLPEVRLLLARGRSKRRRVDGAEALGQDPESAATKDLPGTMKQLLDVLRSIGIHVSNREGGLTGQRRVVTSRSNLLGPNQARDINEEAAAVSLAVNAPRSVEHLLQRAERDSDRLETGRRVLAHGRVDRARIVL